MVASEQLITDIDLRQAVLRRFAQASEIGASNISVEAKDGVVTLKGVVRSRAEKSAAEKVAMLVDGINVIVSDIEVRPILERTDMSIAKDIARELQSHVRIPIDPVKVIVSEGQVRLEGVVRSQFERLLAEAAVKSVRGITSIRSNIEVKPQAFSTEVERRVESEEQETSDLYGNKEAWCKAWAAEAR